MPMPIPYHSTQGEPSNGNGWTPHHLRPYVMPDKDASFDAVKLKRDLDRFSPVVHPYVAPGTKPPTASSSPSSTERCTDSQLAWDNESADY